MAPTSRAPHKSGIKIEEDPKNITPLPPYAKELRDMLLNFEGVVPFNTKIDLEGCCQQDFDSGDTEYRPPHTLYSEPNDRTYLARWMAAGLLRDKARELGPDHSEDDWKYTMSSFVFETINNQASVKVAPLRDLVSWGSDQPFTNAISMRGLLDETQPKPDFWFGLGLYNNEQISRLKGLELADKGIQYFKQTGLKKIKDHHDRFVCQPVKSKGSIRAHKSTQTLGDDQTSPTRRARYELDEDRSKKNSSSRSDTADSRKRSTLCVPVTGRSRSSTSEARNRFQDRNPSATNQSHRSHSSEPRVVVGSEPSPHSTIPSQKGIDRSPSEVDTRLRDIRARVREACVRSLILTNRVHSLVQQITLEQIRAQGS
ncbi:hypothetical protein JMJ35_003771 [Cladonia borealis]|uniref:Uncharacterized protein n=1 Tax=Cladonia borealis TaxID=184061 RepID=A0AA39V6F1_9LECA|nr:hypothetical protein JMJ35_003771 [Cladonia borealis]